MAGWAQTGTGKWQTTAFADRIRNRDNLLLAIWAPSESFPVTTSTNRWEEPVQTAPKPMIETI